MKLPGQCLLQVNEPTSDIMMKMMETTLLLLTKHVAVKLRGCWRRKSAALEVDGVPHALHSIALMNRLTLNSIEKCLDLNNIVHCLTGRGILQNAERQMSHFHHL